jgi:coenzyme F420-0:L-glutamate ligase/coenzyme F420-1:gamma-L-glutamate ligase
VNSGLPAVALGSIRIFPVEGIPEVRPGDDLAALIECGLLASRLSLESGDVVVVAQKVVSKSEGRVARLAEVEPSARARELAGRLGKDPGKVELILRESRRVVVAERPDGKPEGVLITENRNGFVSANAGIDESNTGEPGCAILLPEDPDASAGRLRDRLSEAFDARIGVIVTDSFGRPWRIGVVNVALGVAGVPAIDDVRGTLDSDGRPLTATVLAVADEIAAAAGLAMGKTRAVPVVVVRGLSFNGVEGSGQDLVRPEKEDLFRCGGTLLG